MRFQRNTELVSACLGKQAPIQAQVLWRKGWRSPHLLDEAQSVWYEAPSLIFRRPFRSANKLHTPTPLPLMHEGPHPASPLKASLLQPLSRRLSRIFSSGVHVRSTPILQSLAACISGTGIYRSTVPWIGPQPQREKPESHSVRVSISAQCRAMLPPLYSCLHDRTLHTTVTFIHSQIFAGHRNHNMVPAHQKLTSQQERVTVPSNKSKPCPLCSSSSSDRQLVVQQGSCFSYRLALFLKKCIFLLRWKN